MADDLEDDFLPDQLTALSDNEGVGLDDETASVSANDIEDPSPAPSKDLAKKRKRREKEKEKKAKVCLIPPLFHLQAL